MKWIVHVFMKIIIISIIENVLRILRIVYDFKASNKEVPCNANLYMVHEMNIVPYSVNTTSI